MWYTVWWDTDPVFLPHWTEWSRGVPTDYGYYSVDDKSVVSAQLSYFKKIGIDYLILDDTNGHDADAGNIAHNIDSVFSFAAELGAGNTPKLSVANGFQLYGNQNPTAQAAEMDIVYNYFTRYTDIFYKWKNKPLHIAYTDTANFGWNDSRFTVRRATGTVSTGIDYLTNRSEGLWGWVFDTNVTGAEVMGVMPGWDCRWKDHPRPMISRENGALYIQMWLNAIKADPEAIVISSWNDHAEGTGIEALNLEWDTKLIEAGRTIEKTDPYRYQKITEAYIALKDGFLEGYNYRSESSELTYCYTGGKLVTATPADNELVILVPDDYISWWRYKNN